MVTYVLILAVLCKKKKRLRIGNNKWTAESDISNHKCCINMFLHYYFAKHCVVNQVERVCKISAARLMEKYF